MVDLTELKQKQRATWASGNYNQVAQGIRSVADHVVRSGRIRAGERVLDIACGTGNTAIMARARSAEVTGIDLTPELLDIAKKRATAEGYDDIKWQEGDAESLPFDDGSFDVIVSSCGLMFAPDQQQVANEVARVTKPGGRVAIQAWTREGGVGRLFKIVRAYVPAPDGVPTPFEWGDEEKVKALLGSAFQDYRFEQYDSTEYTDTPEEMFDSFIEQYGPTHSAYHTLTKKHATAFREDMIELFRGYVTPVDGKVRWGREYIVTLAVRA